MPRVSPNAKTGSSMSVTLGRLALVAVAFTVGCGDDRSESTSATGGSTSSGGTSASSGGADTTSDGGPGAGGASSTGGASATGGTATGGTATGGAATGGAATGGTATGGMATGGTTTGGATATGGGPEGGRTGSGGRTGAGGRSAGGAMATGGASAGGESATGGASTGGATATGGTSAGGETGTGGGAGDAVPSAGCGKTPTLKSSASSPYTYNTLTSGGTSRQYILRLPQDYDNNRPYRLILGFHGAGGDGGQVAGNPPYFGLYDLSNGSTIFIAPDAVGGLWSAAADTTLVDDILKQVEDDLCIDTSRVELEGFSQGGAMAFTLACARPGVFRAAVVHSGGGLSKPTSCSKPIAYFSSLGTTENQDTQTSDFFAETDGCTDGSVASFPKPPTGGHQCSDYTGCLEGYPVRWCPYDDGHTPSPTDSGQRTSWMPQEVWDFLGPL